MCDENTLGKSMWVGPSPSAVNECQEKTAMGPAQDCCGTSADPLTSKTREQLRSQLQSRIARLRLDTDRAMMALDLLNGQAIREWTFIIDQADK